MTCSPKTGTMAVVINDAGIITLPQDGNINRHVAIAGFFERMVHESTSLPPPKGRDC